MIVKYEATPGIIHNAELQSFFYKPGGIKRSWANMSSDPSKWKPHQNTPGYTLLLNTSQQCFKVSLHHAQYHLKNANTTTSPWSDLLNKVCPLPHFLLHNTDFCWLIVFFFRLQGWAIWGSLGVKNSPSISADNGV